MGWGEELRAFRRRTNLKQEAVANHLGVSQAFISRLESGHVSPSADMRRRLSALYNTRELRPGFDYWMATIEHSPAYIALLSKVAEGIRIEAVSEGCRKAPAPFNWYKSGDILNEQEKVAPLDELDRLVENGLFSGQVACIKCPWWAEDGGELVYWLSTHVPVRDDFGGWFVHAHSEPIAPRDYKDWKRRHGDTMVVIPFEDRA